MVERKLFKTKLCVLFQRGNCHRQSCSFAHGDAELRGFTASASFNGRRGYPNNELRDRLERRNSPRRRISPRREARGRHAAHGYSPSQSPEKRSERRHRRKQHLDGQSDASGSLKISGGSDGVKERKVSSSTAKNILEEQLKQVQLDIDVLDNRKNQLEGHLEEKAKEAESLISRNEELEAQLRKEGDECKRTISKIKKFIKAHSRYSKAQEELKRSQTRLQRLEDEFASDASRPNVHEEDSSINVASDREPNADNESSHREVQPNYASPSKKRPRTSFGANEEAKTENVRKGMMGATIKDKFPQVDAPAIQQGNNHKDADKLSKVVNRSNVDRLVANESCNKRRKNYVLSNGSLEKVKGLESGHALPPTSMAAHAAVDELIEMEEKIEVADVGTAVLREGATRGLPSLPYLPPPPPGPPKNVYKQYQGEDEDVDVVDLDLETRDADIDDDEVDIG